MTPRDLALHDAELIAAFVDKRLSEEERSAFLARLDKDEALYEVFVETVRYRDQETAEGGKVLEPSVWRKKWTMPVAVAALLAVAVATPLLMSRLSEESYAEVLVADGRLEPYLLEGWYEQPWSEMRGGGSPSRDLRDAAFRLGVRTLDLEVALLADKTEDARVLTYRIEALLQEMEFSEPLQVAYLKTRALLDEEASRKEIVDWTTSSGSLVRHYLPQLVHSYDLGRWTNTGKLAVVSGNRNLLRSGPFRQALGQLTELDWTERVRRHLERISEQLETPAQELDLERLGERFQALIEEG